MVEVSEFKAASMRMGIKDTEKVLTTNLDVWLNCHTHEILSSPTFQTSRPFSYRLMNETVYTKPQNPNWLGKSLMIIPKTIGAWCVACKGHGPNRPGRARFEIMPCCIKGS